MFIKITMVAQTLQQIFVNLFLFFFFTNARRGPFVRTVFEILLSELSVIRIIIIIKILYHNMSKRTRGSHTYDRCPRLAYAQHELKFRKKFIKLFTF